MVKLLQKYVLLEKQGDTGLYHVARIKQWLGYLRKEYAEASDLFSEIRALNLKRHCDYNFTGVGFHCFYIH